MKRLPATESSTSGGLTITEDQFGAQQSEIRGELASLLGSAPFKNSERYRKFLKHLVEQTLQGHAADLKERSIGVDVFGRDALYETTTDPVVRITAGEIRKRLAQYYDDMRDQGEVRISLPPGSYVPRFQKVSKGIGEASVSAILERPDLVQPGSLAEQLSAGRFRETNRNEPAVQPEVEGGAPRRRLDTKWLAPVLALTALISFGAGVYWPRAFVSSMPIDRFWKPLSGGTPLLMSVGELQMMYANGNRPPVSNQPSATSRETSHSELEDQTTSPVITPSGESSATVRDMLWRNNVSWADAIATSRISGYVQAKGQTFRIRRSQGTSLADLRESPAILVGGFNNKWIMALMSQLRFSYQSDAAGNRSWIKDRQDAGRLDWNVHMLESPAKFNRDYGIIARFSDSVTERPVVVISGIAAYGTVSAAEFVTTPKYVEALAKRLPSGWETKNLEVVFTTRILEGNIGPPQILTVYTW